MLLMSFPFFHVGIQHRLPLLIPGSAYQVIGHGDIEKRPGIAAPAVGTEPPRAPESVVQGRVIFVLMLSGGIDDHLLRKSTRPWMPTHLNRRFTRRTVRKGAVIGMVEVMGENARESVHDPDRTLGTSHLVGHSVELRQGKNLARRPFCLEVPDQSAP